MRRRFDAVGFLGASSFLREDTQTAFMAGVDGAAVGGFGEDRTAVLDSLFHPSHPRPLVHLGTDFLRPAGEPVAARAAGTVVSVFADGADFCGWGTRVAVAAADRIWLYGHLGAAAVAVGDSVSAGTDLGPVGVYADNGGWFPHVHVQVCDPVWFRQFTEETVPGYAPTTAGNYKV